MKKVILSLLFLLTSLNAGNSLERKIENISYRLQNGATICLIKLNDGSIWKWVPDLYSENFLRNWVEGEQVIIEAANHPGFVLHNLSKPHFSPTVALSFNSYLIFPAIRQYNVENNSIELDDGSKWELVDGFNKRALCHWTIGDRIVPVRGPYDSFQLINLDIPHENRCQIERHVEVLPHAYTPPTGALAERSSFIFKDAEGQKS